MKILAAIKHLVMKIGNISLSFYIYKIFSCKKINDFELQHPFFYKVKGKMENRRTTLWTHVPTEFHPLLILLMDGQKDFLGPCNDLGICNPAVNFLNDTTYNWGYKNWALNKT
ncbi:hypothetical protein ACJX0J_009705, partial [Zea mays]